MWSLKRHVVLVPLSCSGGCTGCRSASVSTSGLGQLCLEPSTRVQQVTLCVSCTDTNHRGHHALAPLQPCTGSRLFWLPPTFLCCLYTGYLEQYTCFHPWFWHLWALALSKLLWKHTSSTAPTRHATDSHPSVPLIHSFVTYNANQRNICDWLTDCTLFSVEWPAST